MSEIRDTDWLTLKEVAKLLDVSYVTVYRMVTQRKTLPAVKVGETYRVKREQVDAYISVNSTAPPIKVSKSPGEP